jgi:hypothetical protein
MLEVAACSKSGQFSCLLIMLQVFFSSVLTSAVPMVPFAGVKFSL